MSDTPNERCTLGFHIDPYEKDGNYYCSVCHSGMGNAYHEIRGQLAEARNENEYLKKYTDELQAECERVRQLIPTTAQAMVYHSLLMKHKELEKENETYKSLMTPCPKCDFIVLTKDTEGGCPTCILKSRITELERQLATTTASKKQQSSPALDRGMEMLKIPIKDLPALARDFAKHLCQESGMCIEVLLTAYTVYAQCVEGLECHDELYKARPCDVDWFKDHS